jgi:acid stress-induced BolA-like protein IbaG/YrbA
MSWARVNQQPTVHHVGCMDMKHFFILFLSHCEPQWLAMYRQPTIHMHQLTYLQSNHVHSLPIYYIGSVPGGGGFTG